MRLRHLVASVALTASLMSCVIAATAQEATPADSMSAGVTREPLTSEAAERLEGMAGPLAIDRLLIPAGSSVMMTPDDGALIVVVVESGSLEGTSPAEVSIQRKNEQQVANGEIVPAGTPFMLAPGDTLISLAPDGLFLGSAGDEVASVVRIGVGAETVADEPTSLTQGEQSGLVLALAVVVPPSCPPGTEPGSPSLAATPGAGGGGGGAGGVAIAFAAAPACIDIGATPTP